MTEQLKFALLYAISSINWVAVIAIISFTLFLGALHMWLDNPDDTQDKSKDDK